MDYNYLPDSEKDMLRKTSPQDEVNGQDAVEKREKLLLQKNFVQAEVKEVKPAFNMSVEAMIKPSPALSPEKPLMLQNVGRNMVKVLDGRAVAETMPSKKLKGNFRFLKGTG